MDETLDPFDFDVGDTSIPGTRPDARFVSMFRIDALAFLQRRVKHGLADHAALAFLEAGFADRVVASALAAAWPEVRERGGVRGMPGQLSSGRCGACYIPVLFFHRGE